MPTYVVSPGRKITFDSDTPNEKTYAEGDTVSLSPAAATPYVDDGTLYPEGSEPPPPILAPGQLDPATGLLPNGEATSDTPAHLLAPPVQVGAMHATYVPGEPAPDESNPPESDTSDPTVDDLTPEQIEALTPPELRPPPPEEDTPQDEVFVDTPVTDEQEVTTTESEET